MKRTVIAMDNSAVKELITAGVQRLVQENKREPAEYLAEEILRCLAEWRILDEGFRQMFANQPLTEEEKQCLTQTTI